MVVRYGDILELLTVLSDEKGIQVYIHYSHTGFQIRIFVKYFNHPFHDFILARRLNLTLRSSGKIFKHLNLPGIV